MGWKHASQRLFLEEKKFRDLYKSCTATLGFGVFITGYIDVILLGGNQLRINILYIAPTIGCLALFCVGCRICLVAFIFGLLYEPLRLFVDTFRMTYRCCFEVGTTFRHTYLN